MLPVVSVLALFAALYAPDSSTSQRSFDDVARQAETARNTDHLQDAIGLYREGIQMRPSWNEGWWWLGNILYEQDRFPEAKEALNQFTAHAMNPGSAWALLGLCDYETQDFDHSTEHFQKWVNGGSPGSEYLIDVVDFHWALLMTQHGHFERALDLLAGRAKRKGESPILVEAMGLASLRISNLPENYPPEFRERVWLAGKSTFYASAHDFARAQEYSSRLLANYGQDQNVHYFQGVLFKAQHRQTDASEEFRKELLISPRHTAAMLELAQIDLDSKNAKEAATLAQRAAETDPKNPNAPRVWGEALLAAGHTKESIEELELAKRLAPDDAKIHLYLASAYRRAGRSQDAAREESMFTSLKKRETPNAKGSIEHAAAQDTSKDLE